VAINYMKVLLLFHLKILKKNGNLRISCKIQSCYFLKGSLQCMLTPTCSVRCSLQTYDNFDLEVGCILKLLFIQLVHSSRNEMVYEADHSPPSGTFPFMYNHVGNYKHGGMKDEPKTDNLNTEI
jgi:hypothetical protein